MLTLAVYAHGSRIGCIKHESSTQRWGFTYEPTWLATKDRFALCPSLPLVPDPSGSSQRHSDAARTFFENLLPEGRALEEAAASYKVSKANGFGLLCALGGETAGALEILPAAGTTDVPASRRRVSRSDLAERIRDRPYQPFTVWDGRVRLSIAGYQDKLAVLEEGEQWFLVEGRQIASTHLLKPEPLNPSLGGLTTNEHLCMLLARRVGIPTASTRLVYVPEPVLVVERFDRRRVGANVQRLHCIDGCQALGLPVSLKYERPYGDGEHVRHIRDGANLPSLFVVLNSHAWLPVRERMALLRWVIFQVLIGNVDGHAKNLSFFLSARGLSLAPAYDLVCGLIYGHGGSQHTLAMAIGDEFLPRTVAAQDWASFAVNCNVASRLVCREITALSRACMEHLQPTAQIVRESGGDPAVIDRVCEVVKAQVQRAIGAVPAISRLAREELATAV